MYYLTIKNESTLNYHNQQHYIKFFKNVFQISIIDFYKKKTNHLDPLPERTLDVKIR